MIPALAFNDSRTAIEREVNRIGDYLAILTPNVREFSKLANGHEFFSKVTSSLINGLRVSCVSHSSAYFVRDDQKGYELVIPIEGCVHYQIKRNIFDVYGGSSAFLSSSETRRSFVEGSCLIFSLDKTKLQFVCGSMREGSCNRLTAIESRVLPVEMANISFLSLFKTLVSQIDITNGNSTLLEKLSFDDRIYRLSAALIYPDVLLSDEPVKGKCPQVSSELGMLCEYLRANLEQPISLTQMEQVSGLSARKLQYAFRKEFGMGAWDWLRKQRLHAARDAMLNARGPTTVAFVAYDFCFVSPSEFSYHYQKEFGELPEQMLRRRRS